MKFKILEVEQNTPKWSLIRQQGLGGSDAGAICGLSKWKTPYDVYIEKTQGASQIETPAMRRGKLLEPVVKQMFFDVAGIETKEFSGVLQSEKYPFLLASLDGYTKDNQIVEIKTSNRPDDFGEDGTDEVPDIYNLQVQHYMLVTGFEVAYMPVLFFGENLKTFIIEADKDIQEMLLEQEHDFWHKNVLARVEPDLQIDDVVKKYTKSNGKEIEVTEDSGIMSHLHVLKEIRENKKRCEQLEADEKSIVQAYMQDNEILVKDGVKLATWKSSKPRQVFNAKLFQQDHPELYKKYLETGQSYRTFLIK